jgi:hypothetical protein
MLLWINCQLMLEEFLNIDGILNHLLTENNFQFGLRKLLGNTTMHPVTEAQRVLRIEFSIEVELVRVRENRTIPISGLARCYDAFAGLYDLHCSSFRMAMSTRDLTLPSRHT